MIKSFDSSDNIRDNNSDQCKQALIIDHCTI